MGILLLILYFSGHPIARSLNLLVLVEYYQIIFAFTLLLGAVSFVKVNLKGIERREDRPYRVVALLALVLMPVLALIWGIKGDSPFMWVFDNIQVPMQSTVFALLAFFVASASFRGFRARSVAAGVLLVSALLALLSRSDLGGFIANHVSPLAEWLRDYPSMSARRAILIGIGLGSLTTSVRVILGIERTWLGGWK
jgi:amino acid transporter